MLLWRQNVDTYAGTVTATPADASADAAPPGVRTRVLIWPPSALALADATPVNVRGAARVASPPVDAGADAGIPRVIPARNVILTAVLTASPWRAEVLDVPAWAADVSDSPWTAVLQLT